VSDPRSELVNLVPVVPGLRLDLRYATTRNFTGVAWYPVARAALVPDAARRLAEVQIAAREHVFAIKVFDAYRPLRIQRALWAHRPDPKFVAPPERGSRHNRGAAVDVTLVHAGTGQELPMGTDFDAFVPAAAFDFADLPAEILANRQLLRSLMASQGFTGIASEWWHFDVTGWERWPLLDVPLEDIG
jgi:zinc D-Ala-D-Ala dipeptidase